MNFAKYHALGNVYFVLSADDAAQLSAQQIITLCDAHYGLASDGILIGPYASDQADFKLRIINPDASEAEKSGNGLRIFCRYLFDNQLVGEKPFSIETLGGIVKAQVFEQGQQVRVEMGRASFNSQDIPVTGDAREVFGETIQVGDQRFIYNAASMGNPHCVIFHDSPSEALAKQYGPLLEAHANFPQRINVQFVKVIDRGTLQLEIWERGAGYTHASGSSSCAAFAVAQRLGHCDKNVTVKMRGGELTLAMDDTDMIIMTGSVTAVCTGTIAKQCLL